MIVGPLHVRPPGLIAALVFAYGAVVHVLKLIGSGGHPYPGMPVWLAVSFVSLTLADPAVAVGLVRQWRRSGRAAALVVLAADAAANGYANYVVITAPGITPGCVGYGVIALLAVATAFTVRGPDRSSPRRQR